MCCHCSRRKKGKKWCKFNLHLLCRSICKRIFSSLNCTKVGQQSNISYMAITHLQFIRAGCVYMKCHVINTHAKIGKFVRNALFLFHAVSPYERNYVKNIRQRQFERRIKSAKIDSKKKAVDSLIDVHQIVENVLFIVFRYFNGPSVCTYCWFISTSVLWTLDIFSLRLSFPLSLPISVFQTNLIHMKCYRISANEVQFSSPSSFVFVWMREYLMPLCPSNIYFGLSLTFIVFIFGKTLNKRSSFFRHRIKYICISNHHMIDEMLFCIEAINSFHSWCWFWVFFPIQIPKSQFL